MNISRSDDGSHGLFQPWVIIGCVVVVIALAAGMVYALGRRAPAKGSPPAGNRVIAAASPSPSPVLPLQVISSSPADGAQNVASDAVITIDLSSPLAKGTALPTISPAVAGNWQQVTATSIEFVPTAPLIPSTHEVVTIPGGPGGMQASDGATLAAAVSIHFIVNIGDMLRLQQLLGQLHYLPLSFTPTGPPPAVTETVTDQPGTFTWLYPGLPATLTSLWTPGQENVITQGAVMTFERVNGLQTDGIAGSAVWAGLLKAVASGTVNTAPYTYVLVSKTLPENLTLYNNGTPTYANIPVNTGLHGADTPDGTYAVFEHVTASDMKGTNPNGTTYNDPNVPWASYFHGGDALHGFVRATYGSPQSNGCVEMTVSNAQMLWPLTPVGTLVSVVGPAY